MEAGREMSQMWAVGGPTENSSTVCVSGRMIRTMDAPRTRWSSVRASAKSGSTRTASTNRWSRSKRTNSKISHSSVASVRKMVSFNKVIRFIVAKFLTKTIFFLKYSPLAKQRSSISICNNYSKYSLILTRKKQV